ncbi:MlaD family protein [Pseudonocardia spinosispora]|uniref:MlaD family protein n=1 Tax=Pseudonocardia spinosispora TaxID=103441 RepID=UPI0003FD8F95|nr:MlaD family protein [Pseudonocardia spinosispora]
MITRATMVRAAAFLVLTVALVVYIGAHFLGVFNFIGAKPYTVHMPVSDAAGLFPRSEVTFRGVKVGEVGPIELTDNGAVVDLVIDGGGPNIPADLNALVADRSAVGERYVDLRPNRDTAPFLRDGATIPADRVALPVPVQDVLKNLDTLAASVPLDDLRTSVSELGIAFNGLGPKLQLLLDSTNSLTESAMANLPQTLALIKDARTVLQTQNDLADPIKSFSGDLKNISEQLKDSDPDIRRLLETGPEAAHEVSALLDESGDGLHDTIKQSLTLSQITKKHLRGIQSVLQLYPGLAAAIPTLLPGDGTAHLGFVINLNDPPPCTKGYEATNKRSGTDISPQPVNYRAYCREPLYSPTNVRGIKPGYPFVNGKPSPAPDWFRAFYSDGPAAGIFGPARGGGHHGSPSGPDSMPALPGLLGAPATFGSFGLNPGS